MIKQAYRKDNFPLFIGKVTFFPPFFTHDPTRTHYPPPSSSGCCAGNVVLIVDAIRGWQQRCWKQSLSDMSNKNKERQEKGKEADDNISIHKDDETEPVHLIP